MIEVMVVSLKAPQGKPTQLSAHMLHNKFETRAMKDFVSTFHLVKKQQYPVYF
jgi:hypothetical protein